MEIKKGVYTALITPFEGGKVHNPSLVRLVEDQIKKGIDGFVVLGTTGEATTLTSEEKKEVFELVKQVASSQVSLIVGTGSNNTAQCIENSRLAMDWGADGLLIVTPYYNKPPQRGLLEHYQKIAKSVSAPIFLYDVPGRTGVQLEIETVEKLSKEPNIIGVKDATGDVSRVKPFLKEKDFLVFSGDDGTLLPFFQEGGHGTISVLSHVLPEKIKLWLNSPHSQESQQSFKQAKKLTQNLFVESNPIPVKMALYLMNLISTPELRSPLVSLDPRYLESLKKELFELGVVS